jgi:hypothetical protein
MIQRTPPEDFWEVVGEVERGELDGFKRDNYDWLVEGFVEENGDLWEAFTMLFGEDTHGNGLKVGFCEYHKEDFDAYCREEWEMIK